MVLKLMWQMFQGGKVSSIWKFTFISLATSTANINFSLQAFSYFYSLISIISVLLKRFCRLIVRSDWWNPSHSVSPHFHISYFCQYRPLGHGMSSLLATFCFLLSRKEIPPVAWSKCISDISIRYFLTVYNCRTRRDIWIIKRSPNNQLLTNYAYGDKHACKNAKH